MTTRGKAMPFTGRWRIVEMETWDSEDIDLIEPGFIEFSKNRTGEFGFIAVRGSMDCRTVERDSRTVVEFSWEGDEGRIPRGTLAMTSTASLAKKFGKARTDNRDAGRWFAVQERLLVAAQ
jgi:hypothetical protein